MSTAVAQKVSIPDPVLNGAVRQALHELQGPLTVQDMVSLTNLNAHNHCLGDCEFPSSLTVIDQAREDRRVVFTGRWHVNPITRLDYETQSTNSLERRVAL